MRGIGGFAITCMIIDDCLHDIVTHDSAMRGIYEAIARENLEIPSFSSKKVNTRLEETNDWRRKGRRGFKGYHRYA